MAPIPYIAGQPESAINEAILLDVANRESPFTPELVAPDAVHELPVQQGMSLYAKGLEGSLIIAGGPVERALVAVFDGGDQPGDNYSKWVDVDYDKKANRLVLSEREETGVLDWISINLGGHRRSVLPGTDQADIGRRRIYDTGAYREAVTPGRIVVIVPEGTPIRAKLCEYVAVHNVGGHFQGRIGRPEHIRDADIYGANGVRLVVPYGRVNVGNSSGPLSIRAARSSQVNIDGHFDRTRLRMWGYMCHVSVSQGSTLGLTTGAMYGGTLRLPADVPHYGPLEVPRPATDVQVACYRNASIRIGTAEISPPRGLGL